MKDFVFSATFEHSRWISDEAAKVFGIQGDQFEIVFQAQDESMAERLAFEALTNLVEEEELHYICNHKYGSDYTTAEYAYDHIRWCVEEFHSEDFPLIINAPWQKDINDLIDFVAPQPPELIEYIAVYHWEGYDVEFPVKIEAENEQDAEAELISAAVKWAESQCDDLDCAGVESFEEYVRDFFHIDLFLPLNDIKFIQHVEGGA